MQNLKINQSIFKSSWVPNLVKCMRVVCEKQWVIWLQKCKMDKENNTMHVNPIINEAWKDWLDKNLKTKNFPVLISETLIKHWLRETESFEHKNSQFWLVEAVKNFIT